MFMLSLMCAWPFCCGDIQRIWPWWVLSINPIEMRVGDTDFGLRSALILAVVLREGGKEKGICRLKENRRSATRSVRIL